MRMIYIYIAPFIPKDLRVPHKLKYSLIHRSNVSWLWHEPARQEKRTRMSPHCLEQEAFLGSWSDISSCADLAGPCNQTCGELSDVVLYLLLRQKGPRWPSGGFQVSHRRLSDQGRSFLTNEVLQLLRIKISLNDAQHTGAALAQYISSPSAEGGKHYPQGWDGMGWGWDLSIQLRSAVCPHELPTPSISEHLSLWLPVHTACCCAEHHHEHGLPPPGCFQKRVLNINLLIFKCIF